LKKPARAKLTVPRETIRALVPRELARAAGGDTELVACSSHVPLAATLTQPCQPTG
jgi:hypothetical protein